MASIPEQKTDLPQAFRRLLSQAIILPLTLAFLVGAVFVWQVSMLLSVNEAVERSDRITDVTNQVQMLMVDMETGLRAYVITQDATFLEPFDQALPPLEENIQELRQSLSAKPEALVVLDRIIDSSKQWQQYATMVKSKIAQREDARSTILTGTGKRLMDAVRQDVKQLVDQETILRQQLSHTARLRARVVLSTSIGLCVAIGILSAFLARRQLFAAAKTYTEALRSARESEQDKSKLLANERTLRSAAEHANRMKDEFLSTLSHELRTPLNAILGWSQLLRQNGNESQELSQGLETIERNARLQTQLIEDLLDMSRIISGKIRIDIQRVAPVAFIEAAIQSIKPAAEAKEIRIEQILDQHAGPISGDPARLQQVLWNLLSNAVKFTPKGGKVQVRLERVNSHLEITVADTGQGIKPEFLPYVFDRFRQADASTTRSYSGLGLGLAIVKQLVELHGGGVRVKSPGEGKGTTFVVNLPLVVVHSPVEDETRLHPKTPSTMPFDYRATNLNGVKILVVDDQLDARELIKHVLEERGGKVITAASADEGLPLLEREKPNVLLSDIGMPEVDGFQFLKQVRALSSEKGGLTPAIALTAFARSEDRTRAMLAGFVVYITKPVEPAELVATVASVAGRIGNAQTS
ncbi:MAG TPA: ATP-binding protein [Pirellulales bacterium]|nr:ATP-binding protein [Pirellulales bacterium]